MANELNLPRTVPSLYSDFSLFLTVDSIYPDNSHSKQIYDNR